MSRAFAAGRTFISRTLKAEWAARNRHTTVVDAAGAIYVIGGNGGSGTYLKDVWASTDGGARPDCVSGVVVEGTPGRYYGGLQGTNGTTWGYCRGTRAY